MPPIYLDVDDEITSAVARIRAAGDGPVVLVVPFGSRLASSRINFRLLAREAEALTRDLTIVAPEPATRALAASAGLPTHATVMEYEAAAAPQLARPGSVREAGAARPDPAAGSPEWADAARGNGGRAGAGGGGSAGPPRDGGDLGAAALPPPRSPGDAVRGPGPAPAIPFVGPLPRRAFTRNRLIVVLVALALLASVAGAAALAFLPSAEITLTPAGEPVGPLSLTVTGDPAAAGPDPDRLVVPATRLSVPVSIKDSFPATGKQVTEAKATGSVTFTSCDTSGPRQFAAGTVVRTAEGVSFATDATARLDRAKINAGSISCPTAHVPVTAVKAGTEGNVAANTIKVLPGGVDTYIFSVTNPAATSGGVHQENPLIQKSDVDSALATLRNRVSEAFAAGLADPATVPAGSNLVGGTERLGEVNTSPDPNGLVGTQVASFELTMTATGTALAVDPTPVSGLAETKLAAAVGAGYQLLTGSARTTIDPPIAGPNDTVTFAVRVRGERIRELDEGSLRAQVLGKSIAAARSILQPYGEVQIRVWPDWVTSIPGSDGRVMLTIAPATATPSASPAATSSSQAPPTATTPGGSGAPARTASPARSAGPPSAGSAAPTAAGR